MRVITSPTHIATTTIMHMMGTTMELDVEAMCLTPYGFFFPIHSCCYNYVRLLRGETSIEEMEKQGQAKSKGNGILVDHLGKATFLIFDQDAKDILHVQLTKGYVAHGITISGRSTDDSADALRKILKTCTSIENAVERTNANVPQPLRKVEVYSYEQLAARLKETDNTKIFTMTSLQGQKDR